MRRSWNSYYRTAGSAQVTLLAFATLAGAQPAPKPIDPADLLALRTISSIQLSPDGRQVAFAVRGPLAEGGPDARRTRVHLVTIADGTERIVTSVQHDARSPKWSPDGRYLAYLTSESGTSEVWIAPVAGGAGVRATHSAGSVSAFEWSPDGTRFALVVSDPADPSVTARRQLVQASTDPAPISRLWIAPARDSGTHVAMTDASLHVMGVPSWSPDGSSLAFNHASSSELMATAQTSVSIVELATGRSDRLRFVGEAYATPIFSPDGQWLAFRALDAESTSPTTRTGLYALRVDGRAELRLSEADAYTELSSWTPDSRAVIVTVQSRTARRVLRVSLGAEAAAVLYEGGLLVRGLSLDARGSSAAFLAESLESPPEVHFSPLSRFRPRAVSSVNRDLALPAFGVTELVRWNSADGTAVEGLLTYPIGFTVSSPVPLLVVAHAGGETFSASFVANPFSGSSRAYPPPVFTSRGYAVLRVNQRGGGLEGYGFEASVPWFKPEMKANQDVLAGVDHLIARRIADPDRIAIMGWSNGGLVTASLIANTNRFAAASMMAGIPFLTVAATASPWARSDLGAAPWDDLAPYHEHSPEFALASVTTPTLILHGDADPSVSPAQSRSLFESLTARGVATELAMYQGMAHSPGRPSQMIDIAHRNLVWFERYLRNR